MNAFHLNYMLRAVFFVHTKKCKGKISKFDISNVWFAKKVTKHGSKTLLRLVTFFAIQTLSSDLLKKYSISYKYKK